MCFKKQAEQKTNGKPNINSFFLFVLARKPGPDGMTRSPELQFHSETHTIARTHKTTSPATPPGRCPFEPGLDLSGRRWSPDRCCPLPLRPKIRGQDTLRIFIETYQYSYMLINRCDINNYYVNNYHMTTVHT